MIKLGSQFSIAAAIALVLVVGSSAAARAQYFTVNPPLGYDGTSWTCGTSNCAATGCSCGTFSFSNVTLAGYCLYSSYPSVCCTVGADSCPVTTCSSGACSTQAGTCVAFEGFGAGSTQGICVWSPLVTSLGSECVTNSPTTGSIDPTATVIPTYCLDPRSSNPWGHGDCNCDGVLNEYQQGQTYCTNRATNCSTSSGDGGVGGTDGGVGKNGVGPTFTGQGGCAIAAHAPAGTPLSAVWIALPLIGLLLRRRHA